MTSRRADRIGGPYALHQAPIGPPGRYRLTTELDDCCVPELKRQAQAHVVATPLRNQLEVSVLEVEHPVQLGPSWRACVTAEHGCLIIGQELHRHARKIAPISR
jgi:hypothetical protein